MLCTVIYHCFYEYFTKVLHVREGAEYKEPGVSLKHGQKLRTFEILERVQGGNKV